MQSALVRDRLVAVCCVGAARSLAQSTDIHHGSVARSKRRAAPAAVVDRVFLLHTELGLDKLVRRRAGAFARRAGAHSRRSQPALKRVELNNNDLRQPLTDVAAVLERCLRLETLTLRNNPCM